MDYKKKPDYADSAYREAVSRLRILLAESYTPIKRPLRDLDSAGEETDNQSVFSGLSRASRLGYFYHHSKPLVPRKYPYFTPRTTFNVGGADTEKAHTDPPAKWEMNQAPPELMSFIERQEDYIEQLEKESRFCKDELSTLLSKVKDVISENENLHEKQKNHLISSVFNHLETETETETELDLAKLKTRSKSPRRAPILEGPTIVFESRISELEAQLTQAKIDLKKAQDECETYRKKVQDGTLSADLGFDTYKKQVDALQREKTLLQDSVNKLQGTLAVLREKENDSTDKVKRSLDVAEQAQYEKNAADLEIRRLKDELERQHAKLRDAIQEQGRRVSDERNTVERRYTQQVEELTNELRVHWETTSKLQLELDKQRREDSDLRRELAQKQAYVDELKKEMQSKMISMQSDMGVNSAEKSALETQIATLQMANERNERQAKQEQIRLQAELQSLRQRLDRADADLIHSRRENIRLSEQVASLEKEVKLNAALSDERNKRSGEIVALPPPKEDREKELSTMIKDMENKHVATVAELEGMIHSQNQLMDKLSNECHSLTRKLEDASARHKVERSKWRAENGELMDKLEEVWMSLKELQSHPHVELEEAKNGPPTNSRTKLPDQHPQNQQQRVDSTPKLTPRTDNKNLTSPNEIIKQPIKTNDSKPLTMVEKTPTQKVPEKEVNSSVVPAPQQEKVAKVPTADNQKSPNGEKLPENTEQMYGNNDYANQQYYDQQQYDQQYNQHYNPEEYAQYDPNVQYDHGDQPYDPNQHYEGDYGNYDPNNPQYMTQEQYEQYGYNTDPNAIPYDPNQPYDQGDFRSEKTPEVTTNQPNAEESTKKDDISVIKEDVEKEKVEVEESKKESPKK